MTSSRWRGPCLADRTYPRSQARSAYADALLNRDETSKSRPGAEQHYLDLFFMIQGRPYNQSVRIEVTEADEPAVRARLAGRSETMRAMRGPVLG
jgi:hypothetical protein